MGKGVALGFAAGLLAGWLLFGLEEDTPPSRGREKPRARTEREPEDRAPPERRAVRTAPPVGARFLENASVEELDELVDDDGLALPAGAVAILSARLDAARQAKDWDVFRATLELLARADTKEAHAKMVELIGDEALRFHTPMGSFFFGALARSDAAGLAEAARRRMELELTTEHPGNDARRWFPLVALHGDADDLARLEALLGDKKLETRVIQALAEASARPEVSRWLVDLYRGGDEGRRRSVRGRLQTFARRNPEAVRVFVEEEFMKSSEREARDLAYAYGQTLTGETLQEAKKFMLDQRDPVRRMQLVHAVQRMHQRGLDISGLESIVVAPVEELERLGPGSSLNAVRRARSLIERNRLTWTDRALQALENAQKVHKRDAKALARAARRIQDRRTRRETGWNTRR